MGYAFISYSTKNQRAAETTRALFNQNGVDTWMAPYDIPAGGKYAAEITKGIRSCSCFVLLLSEASQASEAVDSEVELASLTFKKPIVPVELEPLELNDSFTFYIHNKQIITLHEFDDKSPSLQALVTAVRVYTQSDGASQVSKGAAEDLQDTSTIIEVQPPFDAPKNADEASMEDLCSGDTVRIDPRERYRNIIPKDKQTEVAKEPTEKPSSGGDVFPPSVSEESTEAPDVNTAKVQIDEIIIPDGVERICACDYGEYRVSKRVVIPTSVNYIEENALALTPDAYVECQESSYAYRYCKQNKIRNLVDIYYQESMGVCSYCGGKLRGMFNRKCASCLKDAVYE